MYSTPEIPSKSHLSEAKMLNFQYNPRSRLSRQVLSDFSQIYAWILITAISKASTFFGLLIRDLSIGLALFLCFRSMQIWQFCISRSNLQRSGLDHLNMAPRILILSMRNICLRLMRGWLAGWHAWRAWRVSLFIWIIVRVVQENEEGGMDRRMGERRWKSDWKRWLWEASMILGVWAKLVVMLLTLGGISTGFLIDGIQERHWCFYGSLVFPWSSLCCFLELLFSTLQQLKFY